MRELHDGPGSNAPDAGRDAPGGHDLSPEPGRGPESGDRVVRDAAARTAYALEYRQRVKAACGAADAVSPDNRGQDKPLLQDTAGRPAQGADLPGSARELPDARDVLPNLEMAEIDERKFSEYSLNPGHPDNRGKADGWRALGYDVDNPQARQKAARELRDLTLDELLANGKVAEVKDDSYGSRPRVISGITGPNGKNATLVTCWLIEERSGTAVPRLITTWVQPHRDKETGQ